MHTALVGVGLRVNKKNNVIIRNLKISKVLGKSYTPADPSQRLSDVNLADAGDAIGIQEAHNVWVDHVDLSSDMDHNKDYYDGLLDITHGCKTFSPGGTHFGVHVCL
jgi:pectate lyase